MPYVQGQSTTAGEPVALVLEAEAAVQLRTEVPTNHRTRGCITME